MFKIVGSTGMICLVDGIAIPPNSSPFNIYGLPPLPPTSTLVARRSSLVGRRSLALSWPRGLWPGRFLVAGGLVVGGWHWPGLVAGSQHQLVLGQGLLAGAWRLVLGACCLASGLARG